MIVICLFYPTIYVSSFDYGKFVFRERIHFFDIPAPNLHEESGVRIWMKVTTCFHVFIATAVDILGVGCSLSLLLYIIFLSLLIFVY